MKNKLIIGRYLSINSLVRHPDPRAKLMLVFLFIILILFCHSPLTYLWMFALILLFVRLAKTQLWFLIKGLAPVFFFLTSTLMMHILLTKGGYILVKWHGITIGTNGILERLCISLCLIEIVMITIVITLSTSPIDSANTSGRLFAPLKMFKLPVHQLGMIMSIALRFIPTLMDGLDKIVLVQKSCGSEISSGNIVTRIKSFIPLLVPLFIPTFQYAEESAVAMEIRGYDASVKKTGCRQLKWQLRDTLSSIIIIPIIIILLVLKYSGVRTHAYISRNCVSRK